MNPIRPVINQVSHNRHGQPRALAPTGRGGRMRGEEEAGKGVHWIRPIASLVSQSVSQSVRRQGGRRPEDGGARPKTGTTAPRAAGEGRRSARRVGALAQVNGPASAACRGRQWVKWALAVTGARRCSSMAAPSLWHGDSTRNLASRSSWEAGRPDLANQAVAGRVGPGFLETIPAIDLHLTPLCTAT